MKAMPRVHQGTVIGHAIMCPACKHAHVFNNENYKKALPDRANAATWAFNGDVEKPTFTPSMLVYTFDPQTGNGKITLCHSFVTDGRIQFLDDCKHSLRGWHDLPDFPADYGGMTT